MLVRLFVRVSAAAALLVSVWAVSRPHDSGATSEIRPIGAPRGPVRITQFYASTGIVLAGQKARLCYGVENAKSVQISPYLSSVAPVANRCLEIVPEHTTHYAILAEGFDGHTATRFFTIVVQVPHEITRETVQMVRWLQ
jgi:hypothetical protein